MFEINRYRDSLSAYWQVDAHENISSISEIILGETKAYVFFDRHYGDLHSYVRQKKRLKEDEARRLFLQIISAVKHCHDSGVILRDLKLRKFVFKNKERCVHFNVDIHFTDLLFSHLFIFGNSFILSVIAQLFLIFYPILLNNIKQSAIVSKS